MESSDTLRRLRSHAWQVLLGRLLIWLLLAALIGWWFEVFWPAMTAALLMYVLYSLYTLRQVQRWLESRRIGHVPEDLGVLSELARDLERRFRTERLQKRRVINLLRDFREAAAALPDGVIVLDRQQRLVWLNETARHWCGIKLPRDRHSAIQRWFAAPVTREWLSSGTATQEPLLNVAAPVDETKRLALRLIPYQRDQQLLVLRDITQLQQVEQMRRDFVANVSHELRTPLTVLHGYLDLFDPGEYPELDEPLKAMRQQSTRMQNLVEDLLTLSRLEQGQAPSLEWIDMRLWLEELEAEARSLSQHRHLIEVHCSSQRQLQGVPRHLHSAFSNLISNAVRYTPNQGTIRIEWKDFGPNSAFEVRDTGPGIAAEHLPRLTERFYRVSSSRSRESGGTGLGLAIVKHAVTQSGGELQIESQLGQGSCFRCNFPAARLRTPHATTAN